MSVSARPARPTDAGAAGEILYWFTCENDWLPQLYTLAETIAFCGAMIERGWVTIAESEGEVLGFMARDGEEICSLYLSRRGRRQGVGQLLLDTAKSGSDRLWLKAFEANQGARRFYRREGFVETGRGTGADNDENLPDITYVWTRESERDDPRPDPD